MPRVKDPEKVEERSVNDKKVIYSMHRVSPSARNQQVLKDITLGFFYGAKIGVIGLNGSGKSTLLRIMAGQDEYYTGDIARAPGYSVGFSNRNRT